VGEDDLLVEQLRQATVGLQQPGRALVLQPRAALVDPAHEQRREQQREHQLGELSG
jgi:hypothetical protein